MIEHFCAMICARLQNLSDTEEKILASSKEFGPATRIDEQDRKVILGLLDGVGQECSRLELTDAVRRATQLQSRLQEDFGRIELKQDCSLNVIHVELQGLRQTIMTELAGRKFAFIGPSFAQYFEREKLFGERVYENFRDARQEIKNAGNCLAADLATAAVFHLMRTAEFGMRALAGERHVKIKGTELEFADWHQILSALDKEAEAVANWKGRSTGKAAALEFYRGTVRQLDGFKEEFRNHVMHTRKSYDSNQAISVFDRVKEFMQRLALAGLSEKQTKSINWRRKP